MNDRKKRAYDKQKKVNQLKQERAIKEQDIHVANRRERLKRKKEGR
jgi:hypothetical protein